MARALPENVKFTCPIQEKKLKNMVPRMEDLKLDVILTTHTDNTSIRANRAILSASSRWMSQTLSTVSEDYAEIKIPIINGADLTSIWNFMRTGVIELDSKNAKTILMGADFFRLNGLVEKCTSFLKDRLDEFNCLDVFAIAYKYEMSQLKGACLRYAKKYEIHTKEAFFRLNKQQLEDFLDNAKIEPHVQVYYCLLNWYRHDKPNRKDVMNDLCAKYILPHLLEGKCIVYEWNASVELPDTPKEVIILVIYHPEKVSKIDVYMCLIEKEKWDYKSFEPDSNWKPKSTKFLLDERLFVSGGRDEFGTYNYVSYFDIRTKDHHQLRPMLTARSGHSMVEINGDLYVLGGVDEFEKLVRSVDKYDFSIEIWTTVSTLPEGLSDCHKASSADGRLFVAALDNNRLACYDPIANEWTWTKEMTSQMPHRITMTTGNGSVYISGNNSFFQYNPKTDRWIEKLYHCEIQRTTKACCAWNDCFLHFYSYLITETIYGIVEFEVFSPKSLGDSLYNFRNNRKYRKKKFSACLLACTIKCTTVSCDTLLQ